MSGAAIDNLGGSLKDIGDFELVKKLGQGGMGSVFLARQKSLDRQVALKVIAPSFANNADFIARFQREARAVGNLNHPHIVQGIDFGRDDKTGLWHFAMEFVNGPSVSGLLKQGPLDEERALKITLQIAHALEFAHKRGFIHRDIKPDNILLTSGGDAKLADLGLAKHTDADASLTQTGLAVGSPHYISPEQASGDATIDIRCDIYSLGVTLFHMVTGKPPFDGATPAVIMVKHIKDEVPGAQKSNPKVTDACARLIARMTRRDRNQRFKTPAELVEKIEQILSGQATTEIREPVAPRSTRSAAETHSSKSAAKPRAQKKNDALVFAGIGAGVLVLGLIVWAVAGQGSSESGRATDKKVADAPLNADAPKSEAEPAKLQPPRVDPKSAEPAIAQRRPPVLAPEPEQPAAPVVFKPQPPPAAPEKEPAVKAPAADAARLNAVLDKFDAEAMKKNYPEAVRIAKDAASDAALAGVGREVHDLGDLAQALTAEDAARLKSLQALTDGKPHTFETRHGAKSGVVEKVAQDQLTLRMDFGGNNVAQMPIKLAELSDAERKRLTGDFKAATPSEHLAAALQALAADDNAVAGTELSAAKEQSLTPRYQARLDEKMFGAAEATAKSAWEAIERDAGAGKLTDPKAKELSDRLAAFVKDFGKTKFVSSIKDKAAALQERLFFQAQQLTLDLGNGVKLELVVVRPGKFMLGSPAAEAKRNNDFETQHAVTLTQPYYMGKYPVTQEQYEALMAGNPSTVKAAKNPVDTVSWNDAQEFCAKLSKKTEKNVKLPTEAQWEYACRAGSTTVYYFGDADKDLGDYCWYQNNSDDRPTPAGQQKPAFAGKMTHPVGLRKPNAWGLFDMHGNVCQWCQDWFEKFTDQAAVDPTGPAQGKARVLRGGSSNLSSADCRSAFRISYPPERVSGHVGGFGFRVIVVAP